MPPARGAARARFQSINLVPGIAILFCLLLVAPPFFYLLMGCFTVPLPGFRSEFGLENYRRVLALDDLSLWRTTLVFALGSSCVAISVSCQTYTYWARAFCSAENSLLLRM